MPAPPIRLVTRGDDLGGSHSANLGIQEAFTQGVLRNAGVLVTAPFAEEAAALLAGERGICFGLHLTLTAEWDRLRWGPALPPERVPSLVGEDGTFPQTTREVFEKARVEEMLAEFTAQLARGRELGFDIRYADTHMGVSWVLEAKAGAGAWENWLIAYGLQPYENRCRNVPFSPRTGARIADDHPGKLVSALETLEPGDYLLVGHPGYDNAEMRALGHPGYSGEEVAHNCDQERRMFVDPRVLACIRERGILPCRIDDLLRA
jgi:hypothetical protein